MPSQATIIIPTHNRPRFLTRLLLFLSQARCPWPVVVVDSSGSQAWKSCEAVVRQVRDNAGMDIEYVHRDQGLEQKCLATLKEIRTPYVTLCADDDFVNPPGIAPCVSFLEKHPEYALARGLQYFVATGRNCRQKLARFRDLDHPDPLRRFAYFVDNWYSTFYCVHRTEELTRDFELTYEHTSSEHSIILPELMLSYLSVIRGRTRYLPCLFGMRQSHPAAASQCLPKIRDYANYDEHYGRFIRCVASQLSDATGLSLEQAVVLVENQHGRIRHQWESSGAQHRSGVQRLAREAVRPINQLAKIMKHGRVRRSWRSHPHVPQIETNGMFQRMRGMIEQHPDGCEPDIRAPDADAA